MPLVVRFMGHQNELEAETRMGRRVFPRGVAVAVRGGDGHQLLSQQNLQFERVTPSDDSYSEAVAVETLASASDPTPEP